MGIFQAAGMSEKRHASSHALRAPPPGARECNLRLSRPRQGFQPLFSIVVYNEKSMFSVVQRLIVEVPPPR
jgi:hypothetical protein